MLETDRRADRELEMIICVEELIILEADSFQIKKNEQMKIGEVLIGRLQMNEDYRRKCEEMVWKYR